MKLKHGSFFSGIGGFDLAAEEMGWENIFHCEINDFGQKILKYHFKNSTTHDDITTTDFTIYRGRIDILTGGFPCQPYSLAGKREGTDDERHLWPEMLRGIREIKPRWVVGENVPGIVNWNGGLVFEQVQLDLEAEGYEVQTYILPAASVNAPHRRDRVWFIAYSYHDGHKHWGPGENRQAKGKGKSKQEERQRVWADVGRTGKQGTSSHTHNTGAHINMRNDINGKEESKNRQGKLWAELRENGSNEVIANSECNGSHKSELSRSPKQYYQDGETRGICRNITYPGIKQLQRFGDNRSLNKKGADWEKRQRLNPPTNILSNWGNFPSEPPLRIRNDGLSTELVRQRIREDSMGYLSEKEIDKIISKAVTEWHNETIKAGGNAIVHQVALQIYKSIEAYENLS